MKVGDFVVERLHAWGVRRIYGYPGDGINGVIGALQRAGNIEFIQVRHEEMAASGKRVDMGHVTPRR
jgi:pyruvate dehydrogenase (quinone)